MLAEFLVWFMRSCPDLGIRKIAAKTLGRVVACGAMPTPYGFLMEMRLFDNTNRIVFENGLGSVADFVRNLPEDCLLLDIGANQGAVALLAAAQSNRRVVAFEPSTANFAMLQRNLALNAGSDVAAMNCGISGSRSAGFINDSNAGHSGSAHIANTGSPVSLRRIKLDDLDSWGGQGRTLFAKIDTEGFELDVLKGMSELLEARRVQSLIVEIDAKHLGRFGAKPFDIYAYLKGCGYRPRKGLRTGHYDEVFDLTQIH